jgi:hypothetical protein
MEIIESARPAHERAAAAAEESHAPRETAPEAGAFPEPSIKDRSRTQRGEPSRERSGDESRPPAATLTLASAAEAREAMKDPHVSKVVDILKGKVIEVKHDAKPTH